MSILSQKGPWGPSGACCYLILAQKGLGLGAFGIQSHGLIVSSLKLSCSIVKHVFCCSDFIVFVVFSVQLLVLFETSLWF